MIQSSSHKRRTDLRTSWSKALAIFALPFLLVLTLRWLVYEPFLIPSSSMEPNLFENDYILISKFDFGFRLPFTHFYLARWAQPIRGDIIVFSYPKDTKLSYVKRVIGGPGDRISVVDSKVYVNGQSFEYSVSDQQALPGHLAAHSVDLNHSGESFEDFASAGVLKEQDWVIRQELNWQMSEITVPHNQFFVMGDNRQRSADSRDWGFVDQDLILGKVRWIWLSCEEKSMATGFCDLTRIRKDRVFKRVL